MIRKQTWGVLGLFLLLLAAAIIFQNRSALFGTEAEVIPSPTSPPTMIEGWQTSDIAWIDLQDNQGNQLRVLQNSTGEWVLNTEDGEAVNAGVVEEVRSQITAASALSYLDPNYDLDAVGLNAPAQVLTIRSQQGQQSVIYIGQLTPTQNGYYVKVDNAAPIVVSKFTIESILDNLQREQLVSLETFPTLQP